MSRGWRLKTDLHYPWCSSSSFVQDMDHHSHLMLVSCFQRGCCRPLLIFFIDLFSTVNQRNITSDFNDLHSTVQDIRLACQKMPATADDRFAVVMSVSSIKISKMAKWSYCGFKSSQEVHVYKLESRNYDVRCLQIKLCSEQDGNVPFSTRFQQDFTTTSTKRC